MNPAIGDALVRHRAVQVQLRRLVESSSDASAASVLGEIADLELDLVALTRLAHDQALRAALAASRTHSGTAR